LSYYERILFFLIIFIYNFPYSVQTIDQISSHVHPILPLTLLKVAAKFSSGELTTQFSTYSATFAIRMVTWLPVCLFTFQLHHQRHENSQNRIERYDASVPTVWRNNEPTHLLW